VDTAKATSNNVSKIDEYDDYGLNKNKESISKQSVLIMCPYNDFQTMKRNFSSISEKMSNKDIYQMFRSLTPLTTLEEQLPTRIISTTGESPTQLQPQHKASSLASSSA